MAEVPHLLSLATAVPPHVLRRDEVVDMARRVWAGHGIDVDHALPIYGNAGIETRYSCVPLDWFAGDHGWTARNALFLEHAVALLVKAADRCLARAGVLPHEVDAVVAVSTTGIATPSLDAIIIERLDLRRDAIRLPIFGLGCAGGVLGLARAGSLAQAMPGRRVLLLVVELCTLTFRLADISAANIVATALFGDGAAAALVSTAGDGPALTATGEHTWRGSLEVMGWRVEEDGFGVLFSRNIPTIIRERFRPALDEFCERNALTIDDIDQFLCHPGGAKVVDALEEALGLEPRALAHTRAVLREYGNMSSATVLFVAERALAAGAAGRRLLSSLGPGFTAGFAVLED